MINTQFNSEDPFRKVADPNSIHFNEGELQRQKDDYVLYTLGVLSKSEEEARKMAEDGDMAAITGIEISPDAAALIYRTSAQQREKWDAIAEKSDHVPSMGLSSDGGRQR